MPRAENEFFSDSYEVVVCLAMVYHVCKDCSILDLLDQGRDVLSWVPWCAHSLSVGGNVHGSGTAPLLEDSREESLECSFGDTDEQIDELLAVRRA